MVAGKIEGKWGRDPIPQGYNPNTSAKQWCYLCDEPHLWKDPCRELMKLDWVRKEHDARRD